MSADRWVATGIPDRVLIGDGHVLMGPMVRTIDEILVEAITLLDDDFRLMQGSVVLYDGKLNTTWYSGETQTWDPDTQTGAQGNGNTAGNYRKVRLSGLDIIAAGGNHTDPITVDCADTHGTGYRHGEWKSTVTYLDARVREYHAGVDTGNQSSAGVAALWTWENWATPDSQGKQRNPNAPGADYRPMGQFPIDAALPLPWFIQLEPHFPNVSKPAGLYGEVNFGSFAYDAELWTWKHDEGVGADDDLVINDAIIRHDNLAGWIYAIGDNRYFKIADLAAGTDLRVDVDNAGGLAQAHGKLRIVPVALPPSIP